VPLGRVAMTCSLSSDERGAPEDPRSAKFEAPETFAVLCSKLTYSLNGICTNQAESYLSRLRRMVDGQHHHVNAATCTSTPTKRLGRRTIAVSTTAR
jgi:hypothetical protein